MSSDDDLSDLLSDSDTTGKRRRPPHSPSSRKRPVGLNRKPVFARDTDNHESWLTKYEPQLVQDVAVHSARVSELRAALEPPPSKRILLLSGPAGSSKTALLQALCRAMQLQTVEFACPDSGGQMEAFGQFLQGLNFRREPRLVAIVEDLPNVLHYDTRRAFNSALLQWISAENDSWPLLVVVFTEVENILSDSSIDESLVVERIISARILNSPALQRIKFAPVNATLITKALRHIVACEHIVVPKRELDGSVKQLATYGDIRSAIGAFEFWARWSLNKAKGNVPMIGRESHIGYFRAVGRIIFGARKDKAGRSTEPDESVVESVVQDWQHNGIYDTELLSLGALENLPGAHHSQMALGSLVKCQELISLVACTLLRLLPESHVQLVVQGLRHLIARAELNNKYKRLFRPLVYPREGRAQRKRMQVEHDLNQYRLQLLQTGHHVNRSDVSMYASYARLIQGQRPGGVLGVASLEAGTEVDDGQILAQAQPPVTVDPEDQGLEFSDDLIEDSDDA